MDHQTKRIAERARAYVAQSLHESQAGRREREAWLAEDPSHARAYARQRGLWEHAGSLADDPELRALMAADLRVLQHASRRSQPRWLLAAAAVLLVVLGAWWSLWPVAAPVPVKYATTIGERRTESLPDGTRIVLNTDSMIEVRYTRGRRGVDLQRGEAQFEVAHDASRPFVVNVGAGTVTALGTRFQVRRDVAAAETVVTLLEGSVKVAQGETQRVLHPDQQARLSPEAGIRIRNVDPATVDSWLQGRLHFRETPLGTVVAEANRYSRRKLRLGNPALARLAINGNFPAGDSISIALAAEQILPIRVEQRGDEIVLSPR